MFDFHNGVWRGQHEFMFAAPCSEFYGCRSVGAYVYISECLCAGVIGCFT